MSAHRLEKEAGAPTDFESTGKDVSPWRVLGALSLTVILAGCPSVADAVEGATRSGFACDPAAPADSEAGRCPEGAVCGRSGVCHPAESGNWACDPTTNAADGTNVHCFGMDVCGADERCHAASDEVQDHPCSTDAQCFGTRRCSEATRTCTETTHERLLPSGELPSGGRVILPTPLGRLDLDGLWSASPVAAACSSDSSSGTAPLLDVKAACPVNASANHLQTFSWVEGDSLRFALLGRRPIGGNPRTLLSARGLLELSVPLPSEALPSRALASAFQIVLSTTDGITITNALEPITALVGAEGLLRVYRPSFGRQVHELPLPRELGLAPGEPVSLTLVSNGDLSLQAWVTSPGKVTRVDLSTPSAETFPSSERTGAFHAGLPLKNGPRTGLLVASENGIFSRLDGQGPDRDYPVVPRVSGAPATCQTWACILGRAERYRLHPTGSARRVALSATVREEEGQGTRERLFVGEGIYGEQYCGQFQPDNQRELCFPAVCEPCDVARGERAEGVYWLPSTDTTGSEKLVVRCTSMAGTRTVAVRTGAVGYGNYACVTDVLDDELGRDARDLMGASGPGMLLRNDHDAFGVFPSGQGHEVLATGPDRAPHGLTRINGKLAAFTPSRTWSRILEEDLPSPFWTSPLEAISLLAEVTRMPELLREGEARFERRWVVASRDGRTEVRDVTSSSSDLPRVVARVGPTNVGAQLPAWAQVVPSRFDGAQTELRHHLFVTDDDSLLGAEVTQVKNDGAELAAQLQVRLTPRPGSPIQSLVFVEPVDDAGAPLFARGYVLTSNGLQGFEAPSPQRFRTVELPARDAPWVGLYAEGTLFDADARARARLVYRDGVVVSLPGQLPLTRPLPQTGLPGVADNDALVSVLHHCGHTYGLSKVTLFHLTSPDPAAPGSPLGVWQDVLGLAPEERDGRFDGGRLLRDGDTLYLFNPGGHTMTWQAPTCLAP